ncbi:hypothetical protein SynBIOSU31_01208 [Synechococcus sp. BIOS-U3-1]|nr:hypothetical protein SynBIOSU31_01208 [Synechococcus sp. BIOS-U3-1]
MVQLITTIPCLMPRPVNLTLEKLVLEIVLTLRWLSDSASDR